MFTCCPKDIIICVDVECSNDAEAFEITIYGQQNVLATIHEIT